MEYSKLVSVTGLPGLFELIASKNDGAVVRSLDDKSTRFVSSRIHNFSHLESIEVYTEGDNVNLADVFQAMQNSNEKLPEEKDANGVKKYFEKVYSTMDFERVYASDMKKMIKWYSILTKNDVEIKLSEEPVEEEANEESENPVQETEAKETAVKESETEPAVEASEPKKEKAVKAKKEEAVTAKDDVATDSEPKATKKKNAKK